MVLNAQQMNFSLVTYVHAHLNHTFGCTFMCTKHDQIENENGSKYQFKRVCW